MLLWIYRLAFVPLLLLLAPKLVGPMWRRGGYGRDVAHRWGRLPPLPPRRPGQRRVWLQAVSVGEVMLVEPIVAALEREPDVVVLLTTTTSTGLDVARRHYAGRVAAIGYFPLDWLPFMRRAWQRVQPDLVLLTEGERWPELIAQAERHQVPVVVVNARISERSFRRMRRLGSVVPRLLRGVTQLLAVSLEDARRFEALGLDPGRTVVTGNLKLDLRIQPMDTDERARWRREVGFPEGDRVLLGSSTWPGEEAALLAAWRQARAGGVPCRLLLVPRHAERRDELAAWLRAAGVRHHFRSQGPAPAEMEVTVADTTGELRQLTQLADLVFIGRSLPPHHEGQTPVEAAALRRAMLFGPRLSNFSSFARELVAAGAAVVVADAAALSAMVLRLLPDDAARERMGAAAQAWQRANQGAVARTWEQIHLQLHRR